LKCVQNKCKVMLLMPEALHFVASANMHVISFYCPFPHSSIDAYVRHPPLV
jgi:hypothetical protein